MSCSGRRLPSRDAGSEHLVARARIAAAAADRRVSEATRVAGRDSEAGGVMRGAVNTARIGDECEETLGGG